jgi:hypothetical protein
MPLRPIENCIISACIRILSENQGTLISKVESINTFITSITPKLTAILNKYDEINALTTRIDHTQDILLATTPNSQVPLHAVIRQHRESYDYLVSHSGQADEWDTLYAEIERRGNSSIATMAANYLYSFVGPKDTFEADTKTKLSRLSEHHIAQLSTMRRRKTVELNLAKVALSDNLPDLASPELDTATPDILAREIRLCTTIQETLQTFLTLNTRITADQQQLSQIKGLKRDVDLFIRAHDGFLVKLSLFLSKFISILKSDTASKIEQMKAMKSELSGLEQAYDTSIRSITRRIREHQHTPENFNAAILDTIPTGINTPAPRAVTPRSKHEFFQQVRANVSQIQAPNNPPTVQNN